MFYHAIWDPWLIVSQLLLLLSSFYLLLGSWLCLFALAFGTPLRLHSLLQPAAMSLTSASSGWPALGAALLQAPLLGYLLLPVVGRAKQCLDFTLSVYVLHALMCTVYSHSLPWTWEWWGAQLLACVCSVVIGEYLCLQKELEAIPLTADEREARERRALAQAQANAHAEAGYSPTHAQQMVQQTQGTLQERAGLLGGGDHVTTTTIQLRPNNVFNV